MNVSDDYKSKVAEAILEKRTKYSGSDAAFAKSLGINSSVFNRIKSGERDRLINDMKWLTIGSELGVTRHNRKWNIAETSVLSQITEDVRFCKEFSKSMMFVDEPEIGKTVAGVHLSKTLTDCFYVDGSQSKTRTQLIKAIAKAVGIETIGRLDDIKSATKSYLLSLDKPIIIIDEAGDLEYAAFLTLKEYWNATANYCGWYMMGADGLRSKIEQGINNKKVGYKEMLSRFSGKFGKIVPTETRERQLFYKGLIKSVLEANTSNRTDINSVINTCLVEDRETGRIGGLRRAESILLVE